MACNGVKIGSFHLFRHPKWSQINLNKIFKPFLTHFLSQNKAFWDFRRAKTGHRELKMRQKDVFWQSMWYIITFEEGHFFAPSGPS